MPDYKRIFVPGGTYFFTVNLQNRSDDLLVRHIAELRACVSYVKHRHPFKIHAWVVLPDHLHCVIELPEADSDYPLRWRLIKSTFTRTIPLTGTRSSSRRKRNEQGIWQRRYWEHLIRDERDFKAHLDYVHINPHKHGLVQRPADWTFSTLSRYIEAGVYPGDWVDDGLAASLGYDD